MWKGLNYVQKYSLKNSLLRSCKHEFNIFVILKNTSLVMISLKKCPGPRFSCFRLFAGLLFEMGLLFCSACALCAWQYDVSWLRSQQSHRKLTRLLPTVELFGKFQPHILWEISVTNWIYRDPAICIRHSGYVMYFIWNKDINERFY